MKTRQLFATIMLAAVMVQMPILSYALDVKIKQNGNGGIMRAPAKGHQNIAPITSFDSVSNTYTITSRATIPSAVITVTNEEGEVISCETMDISSGYIIEYDFSDEPSGEYEITIMVDGNVKSIESIYVE